MTSPYLEKPRRELRQALRDRGMAEDGFDAGDAADGRDPSGAPARRRGPRHRLTLTIAVLAIGGMGAALAAGLLMPRVEVAQEPDPGTVSDIAPAAGGMGEGNLPKSLRGLPPDEALKPVE